jgi:dinuclear metal center YbgI/SA1388 family protein
MPTSRQHLEGVPRRAEWQNHFVEVMGYGGGTSMADLTEIVRFCDERLAAREYQDAAWNGLQVEGTGDVRRIATTVSANARTINAAVEAGVDALLAHHGLLWSGSFGGALTGPLRGRLHALLANDVSLIAYHLPLDGHAEIGNNACIARELGMTIVEPFAEIAGTPIGHIAAFEREVRLIELIGSLIQLTAQEPIVLAGGPDVVERAAILSGSGYSAVEEAARRRCQTLITGDVREPTMALAREFGITVLAAGHEATERLGVQALAAEIGSRFDVEVEFIHDPNPI